MQISSFVGRAFGAAASVALLASCSGITSQGTPSVGSSVGQSSAHSSSPMNAMNRSQLAGNTSVSARGSVKSGFVGHSSGGGPMVDKKTQVVYVSDASLNEVFGYDQTGGSPFITIGGFSEPQGLATDNLGSVYVADTSNSRVQVFPAGSTTASLTINDAGQYPAGVAVLGNYIYVTNIISTSGGPGSLVSFNKKTGSPYRTYTCGLEEAFFVAADSKGDVFVDGFDNSFNSVVVEFPQASTTCTTLPITLSFPGGLAIDKSGNLLVDDQEGDTTSYAPPGFTTVVATSQFGGSSSDPVTIALTKGNANIWTANAGAASLTEWPYPASGTPTLTISGSFGQPIGVATYERGNK